MRNLFIVALLLVAVAASAQEAASQAPPSINHVILFGVYAERSTHEISIWISQKQGGTMIPVIIEKREIVRGIRNVPLGSLIFVEGELGWGYDKYGDKTLKVRATRLQILIPQPPPPSNSK